MELLKSKDMQKVILVAHSDTKAIEGEALLKTVDANLTVNKVFHGVKARPRHFEAVIFFLAEANDADYIKADIESFKEVPIRAFLGKAGVAIDSVGTTNKAKGFSEDKVADLLNHVRSERSQINEVMTKAFAAFDKDGSGFIDIGELRQISKDLGRQLDDSELDECMKDLDINGDNKISFEEFS